jgi:hypothetical protein
MADRRETEHKSFEAPDETREFPNGRAGILEVGGGDAGRLVLQPRPRWSNDVKPIAQTDSCEAPHFRYHVSGRLATQRTTGSKWSPDLATSPLPSGHDAWVVGYEPAVVGDWYGPAISRRPADRAGASPASPRGRT